jgi:hypothetical protein
MDWIRHRNPREAELRVISPADHPAYGDFFLTWDGEAVDIDFFEIPARNAAEAVDSGRGFWHRAGVLAWRPLPPPPTDMEIGRK